jgi:hypothetical protein
MSPEISFLGVILAAVSALVIGTVWYGPKTFFPRWQKITGATDAHVKASFGKAMIWYIVTALLTAYVMAHFVAYAEAFTGTTGITGGLMTGFWAWIGFSVTSLASSEALDSRDKFILFIQGGDRLLTFLAMGAILGYFM